MYPSRLWICSPLASPIQVLGLQACTTTPSSLFLKWR
jgi:hypothetical protein